MSSPQITCRWVVQTLRPLLDDDAADLAAEEHAAIEAAAVDGLIEQAEREWTAAEQNETAPNTLNETGDNSMDHESADAFELDIANAELRYVVDALARCLEDNQRLQAELDAANDAVLELLAELDEAADCAERSVA